jgi:hypothetical protein
VAEDLLDYALVVNQSDQFHLGAAVLTNERVNFPDLLDELASLFRRDARGLVLGHA